MRLLGWRPSLLDAIRLEAIASGLEIQIDLWTPILCSHVQSGLWWPGQCMRGAGLQSLEVGEARWNGWRKPVPSTQSLLHKCYLKHPLLPNHMGVHFPYSRTFQLPLFWFTQSSSHFPAVQGQPYFSGMKGANSNSRYVE